MKPCGCYKFMNVCSCLENAQLSSQWCTDAKRYLKAMLKIFLNNFCCWGGGLTLKSGFVDQSDCSALQRWPPLCRFMFMYWRMLTEAGGKMYCTSWRQNIEETVKKGRTWGVQNSLRVDQNLSVRLWLIRLWSIASKHKLSCGPIHFASGHKCSQLRSCFQVLFVLILVSFTSLRWMTKLNAPLSEVLWVWPLLETCWGM